MLEKRRPYNDKLEGYGIRIKESDSDLMIRTSYISERKFQKLIFGQSEIGSVMRKSLISDLPGGYRGEKDLPMITHDAKQRISVPLSFCQGFKNKSLQFISKMIFKNGT